ncbi:MAG: VCBS repeat-containing protein [Paraglaciecola sp.]|uniref:FG-GAP repeat domain-containing protein n=1 Tax=Paraglaciecola sp. TaxID=1920173 RepID=UPI0032998BB0
MKNYKRVQHFLFFLMTLYGGICHASALNLGGTVFKPTLMTLGKGESSLAVFDFNSDGHKDLVVSNYADNNIVIYRGNGKGNLTEINRASAGMNPTDIATADINGDGDFDIAIANHETSYMTVLLGDGKGNFNPAAYSPLGIEAKPHLHEVQLHDLDNDNKVDLIVDNRANEGLLVLKGLNDGSFQTPGELINVAGDPYRGFAIADLNADGRLDIVTPNQQEVGIILNDSSERLSFSLHAVVESIRPFSVELADLNGDGHKDLIVASNADDVTIIPGDGTGNFLEKQKTSIKTSSGAKQIAIGDINGDGIKDSLISSWSGKLLIILGNKSKFETISFEHKEIPNPWAVVMEDFNQDGKSDFIISDGNSTNALMYVSQ